MPGLRFCNPGLRLSYARECDPSTRRSVTLLSPQQGAADWEDAEAADWEDAEAAEAADAAAFPASFPASGIPGGGGPAAAAFAEPGRWDLDLDEELSAFR